MKIATDRNSCRSVHSLKTNLGRLIWGVVWTIAFRPTPRLLFGWRRFVLRIFGAKLGENARVDPSVRIWAPWNLSMGKESCLGADVDCYNVDQIRIGDHGTVSQYSLLCSASHDVSSPNMQLITAPIVIENQAWVCAKAFISPGATVGEGSVVGACSVVTKDVPDWTIVAGNPAKFIRVREIQGDRSAAAA